jgi:hypothetical protein
MLRRHDTNRREGSLNKSRSTETVVSFEETPASDLEHCTSAHHRAKVAAQMKHSLLRGHTDTAAEKEAPVKEGASAQPLRQTPMKLERRQAKMLAQNATVRASNDPPAELKAELETEVSNPLEKHYTTHEIAAAWNVHPVTVYRDFVDEKGVVKLGSGSNKRRTRRELRIPKSVLIRVYDKRRT